MEIFHHKPTTATKEQQQFRTHKKTPGTFLRLDKQKVITSQEKKKTITKKKPPGVYSSSIFSPDSPLIFLPEIYYFMEIFRRKPTVIAKK
jgi:hypothetical protein